ncbi:MAG: MBL fold metallo-hydrolase, partial [Verrucomicrobiales bacterium]
VAAAHNEITRDASGHCQFLGFAVEFGPWCVYHSGDTLWHPGLVPALLPKSPDLMLLPINGNRPERRVAGNLNGTEAAALARACGASMVIPCHYDMFEFNTESPEEFSASCGRLQQPHHILLNGESWTSRSING